MAGPLLTTYDLAYSSTASSDTREESPTFYWSSWYANKTAAERMQEFFKKYESCDYEEKKKFRLKEFRGAFGQEGVDTLVGLFSAHPELCFGRDDDPTYSSKNKGRTIVAYDKVQEDFSKAMRCPKPGEHFERIYFAKQLACSSPAHLEGGKELPQFTRTEEAEGRERKTFRKASAKSRNALPISTQPSNSINEPSSTSSEDAEDPVACVRSTFVFASTESGNPLGVSREKPLTLSRDDSLKRWVAPIERHILSKVRSDLVLLEQRKLKRKEKKAACIMVQMRRRCLKRLDAGESLKDVLML
ncbi:hypothetical protein L596_005957 [Steinernema carpocapsae]|uniref:Uncharacterized protein n=1 Tax=Steinernema carpocapsae TaxID=34508 RepID=A0A4U8V0X2_STECR|nr:hypothetical protein L596_005957 [Steinernema carpocapsae]